MGLQMYPLPKKGGNVGLFYSWYRISSSYSNIYCNGIGFDFSYTGYWREDHWSSYRTYRCAAIIGSARYSSDDLVLDYDNEENPSEFGDPSGAYGRAVIGYSRPLTQSLNVFLSMGAGLYGDYSRYDFGLGFEFSIVRLFRVE